MAKLDGLIRVQKHTVDEKQKILARLFREQEEHETAKRTIQEQVDSETLVANDMSNDPISRLSFGNFLAGAKQKISDIDAHLEKLEMRIELAQENIRQAFEELKKTEIIDKNRKKKIKKEKSKKENSELDDIGIEGHRRKQD